MYPYSNPYYNGYCRNNSILEYMMMFNYGRRYGCCDYAWAPCPYYTRYYNYPYYGYPSYY